MKNLFWKTRVRCILAFLLGILWTGTLQAQFEAPTQVRAEIDDVTVMMQKTPEFQANVSDSKKDPKRREWLEMEVAFETRSDSEIGIIPELMISYYIAVKGVQPRVLTGSFTYTNVVDEEENFAIIYVSPQGLTRIAGEPYDFREADVASWGVEILYQGRVIAEESESGGAWWNQTSAARMPGLILPKEKTPFSLLWIDRHVQLKED